MAPRLRLPRRRSRVDEPRAVDASPAEAQTTGASVNGGGSNGTEPPRRGPASPPTPPGPAAPRRRPKLKKLRFALVFLGLSILAFVSWIFGIMMAVASDLPQLEDRAQFAHAALDFSRTRDCTYDTGELRQNTITG